MVLNSSTSSKITQGHYVLLFFSIRSKDMLGSLILHLSNAQLLPYLFSTILFGFRSLQLHKGSDHPWNNAACYLLTKTRLLHQPRIQNQWHWILFCSINKTVDCFELLVFFHSMFGFWSKAFDFFHPFWLRYAFKLRLNDDRNVSIASVPISSGVNG